VNKLTNWEGFKEEFTNTIQLSGPLRTIEQLDEGAENFMTIIQKAAWKNTHVLKRKTMGNNYSKEKGSWLWKKGEQGNAGNRQEHLLIKQD
jgi:hypothetical protein